MTSYKEPIKKEEIFLHKKHVPNLQIPYTILGGTYIALYSWRLFYYVEILYLQDGVLIGEAKW